MRKTQLSRPHLFMAIAAILMAISWKASSQASSENEQAPKAEAALKSAATTGDSTAQLILGTLYLTGTNLPRDVSEGKKWLRLSCQQGGNRNACFTLGSFRESTGDTAASNSEYLQIAAENGLSSAQLALALSYAVGDGVPQDPAISARWFHRAARQGDRDAQLGLATMLLRGTGIDQDNEAAFYWATVASRSPADPALADRAEKLLRRARSALQSNQLEQTTQAAALSWKPVVERDPLFARAITKADGNVSSALSVTESKVKIDWRWTQALMDQQDVVIDGKIGAKPFGIPAGKSYPHDNESTEVLLLVDVSKSQKSVGLQSARDTLLQLVARAKAHHQLDIIAFAKEPSFVTPKSNTVAGVSAAIETLTLKDETADLGTTLERAIDIPSAVPTTRRAIFVFTGAPPDIQVDSIIGRAHKTNTSISFVGLPSTGSGAMLQLSKMTGGRIIDDAKIADFLKEPYALIDSGGTVEFSLPTLTVFPWSSGPLAEFTIRNEATVLNFGVPLRGRRLSFKEIIWNSTFALIVALSTVVATGTYLLFRYLRSRNRAWALLQCIEDEQVHQLRRTVTHLGRSAENEIVLPDNTVSRFHAIISRSADGRATIEDRGGSNGTLVNHLPVARQALGDGDIIILGSKAFRFTLARSKQNTTRLFSSKDQTSVRSG